jgi:hypothetical protein
MSIVSTKSLYDGRVIDASGYTGTLTADLNGHSDYYQYVPKTVFRNVDLHRQSWVAVMFVERFWANGKEFV